MMNPSKITEGGIVYSIGKFDGKNVIYDFPKILEYLSIKGKLMFGQKFRILEEDRKILTRLCVYFVRDRENCGKYGLDPDKGLLLSGPVGCGKTSIMQLLRFLVPHQRFYQVIPCRNIVFGFNHLGYKTIQDYGDSGFFCFDDLGVEPMGRFYGKECNVLGEIFLSRYELFLQTKIKTHATTNLNAREIEEWYGERVRSRMRQFFNLVAFDKNTPDKRN